MTDTQTATVTLKFRFGEDDQVNMKLDVLGLVEDGSWCAIALSMGIRGYGRDFNDALSVLKDAIRTQVEFALTEDGNIDQLFFPAEKRYIDLYIETNVKEQLKHVAYHLGRFADAEGTSHGSTKPRPLRRSVSVRVPESAASTSSSVMA